MRRVVGCVALVVLASSPGAVRAQTWRVDAAATLLVEAWDQNERREALGGLFAGVESRLWRDVALRLEGVIARVRQHGDDAWLVGYTVGTRARWSAGGLRPYLDIGAGISHATREVPLRGTQFNFLATAGGGIELPLNGVAVAFGPRWLHLSNNGRQGRGRNPDIQSLGFTLAVVFAH